MQTKVSKQKEKLKTFFHPEVLIENMVCRKQLDPIENYDPSLVLQLDLGRGRQADVHVEHLLRADGFLRKLLCQVFNVRHGPLVRSGCRLYQCAKLASVLEIKMLGPLS